MIHLIENYYADPNNMGFTLVIDKDGFSDWNMPRNTV